MAKKNLRKDGNLIGAWAFLIGIVLAVIFGAINLAVGWIAVVLFILGIVIGLLNITDKESTPFLLAGTALVIVSYFGSGVLTIIPTISKILDSILILFVPATIIVAIRAVFQLARR